MVAILLCRIDPVITGFPEIVMGAYLDFQLGIDARIQSADPKYVHVYCHESAVSPCMCEFHCDLYYLKACAGAYPCAP